MRNFLILCAVFLVATPIALADTVYKAYNAIKPVYLDYSMQGTNATSPDGKFAITVTGEKASLLAWVTLIEHSQGWSIQVWPIERNVTVLWQPDSHNFVLTDNRYANESYVLIIGTKFHMRGPLLGLRRYDITPMLRQALDSGVKRYYRQHYGTTDFDDSYQFYAKALCWTSNERLLVGVSTVTSLVAPAHVFGKAQGVKGWLMGYIIDVPQRKIVQTLSEKALKEQYGIDLSKLN